MSVRNTKRLLVTGGAGFVGSYFIDYAMREHDVERVIVLDALTYAGDELRLEEWKDDERFEFVEGEIADRVLIEEILRVEQIDTIVHFAAETHVDRSIEEPLLFVRTNVLGTVSLLELLVEYPDIHFHHVSSDEIFGELSSTGRFCEMSRYDPSSPYSASKAASDHFVRAYGKTYGLSYTLSYSSNNYGPRQHKEKFIPHLIESCYEQTPMHIYGKGENVRDWLYVEEHAFALWQILEYAPSGSSYCVGANNEWSNLSLAHLVCDLFAEIVGPSPEHYRELITFVEDRPGHDFRYALDCTKIERELGFRARVSLREGLEFTIRDYLERMQCLPNA